MTCTVVDFGKDSVVYNITGISREELENKLNLFFASEKLLLKSDTPEKKIFRRGNKVMRILFGAFIKYFNVVVEIKQQADIFSVRLWRDMNLAMSGGLIGINSSRKEFTRINDAFKEYMK